MVVGACVVAWGGGGGCVVAGGGMCGCRGACVVAGGKHGCWGACVVVGGMCDGRGACMGYDEIRSMSGQYASYWNAFLLLMLSSYLQPRKLL